MKSHDNDISSSDLNHPLEAVQTTHLGSSVDGSHPVLCPGQQVAPGLPHEVLKDVQVALLGSKVDRGHGSGRHGTVGAVKKENEISVKLLEGKSTVSKSSRLPEILTIQSNSVWFAE